MFSFGLSVVPGNRNSFQMTFYIDLQDCPPSGPCCFHVHGLYILELFLVFNSEQVNAAELISMDGYVTVWVSSISQNIILLLCFLLDFSTLVDSVYQDSAVGSNFWTFSVSLHGILVQSVDRHSQKYQLIIWPLLLHNRLNLLLSSPNPIEELYYHLKPVPSS